MDNVRTSRDYLEIAFQDDTVAQIHELIYETDEGRVCRDLRRQTLYKYGLMQGELLRAKLDLTDVVPGFAALGEHCIYMFYGVDSYGPVFSIHGVLGALGYRSGGSTDQAVRALVEGLPLELKNRVVPVYTNKAHTSREMFADLFTMRAVLLAFGISKQQRAGKGGVRPSSSSGNRVMGLICEALSKREVTVKLTMRLLMAPVFENNN